MFSVNKLFDHYFPRQMQQVYFSDLNDQLKEKFYTYFAKYDTKFTRTEDGWVTVFKPPKNFNISAKPRISQQRLIEKGRLFQTIDINKYARISQYVKNYHYSPG